MVRRVIAKPSAHWPRLRRCGVSWNPCLRAPNGAGKAEKVSPRRFDERVRDTDISYEDLSMGFLYWPNAKVDGEQTMLLRKCWIVQVEPPNGSDSQYSRVMLWVDNWSCRLESSSSMRRSV